MSDCGDGLGGEGLGGSSEDCHGADKWVTSAIGIVEALIEIRWDGEMTPFYVLLGLIVLVSLGALRTLQWLFPRSKS
ncbi:MAG: hypothetical protein RLZZ511_1411 [Cyanobacteriota bacterium]|jgi:hypothetical protein